MSSQTVTRHHYEGGLLSGVLNSSHDGIIAFETVRDDDGTIADFRWSVVNPAAEVVLGRTAMELIGRLLRKDSIGNRGIAMFEHYVSVVETGEPYTAEHSHLHNGLDRWYLNTAVSLGDGIALTLRDITEQRLLQRSLEHQAVHDPLTLLPNRVLIEQRIDEALTDLAFTPSTVTVLFIDLDRFKLINDGIGHAAGDQLLIQFAHRLRDAVRSTDAIGRLGGDEFLVVLNDVGKPRCDEIIDRILTSCRAPYSIDGREIFVSATVGAASTTTHDASPAGLIADADRAMYAAKMLGGDRVSVADESHHPTSSERIDLEADLHHAVAKDELRLLYQPVVCCSTGRVVGAEALVRWEHPQRGLLTPDKFLPIAEVTSLIRPIGTWVLETAARQLVEWIAESPDNAPDSISVNVAAQQLVSPGFADVVKNVLQTTGLEAHRLGIEITETALIREPEAAGSTLRQLAELGCEIALDDFGTGYSPLTYLRHFPVNTIKIDRSFVSGPEVSADREKLVHALIQFAAMLGKRITAEGVEDLEQLEMVKAANQYQGYFFSRPIDADSFAALLAR